MSSNRHRRCSDRRVGTHHCQWRTRPDFDDHNDDGDDDNDDDDDDFDDDDDDDVDDDDDDLICEEDCSKAIFLNGVIGKELKSETVSFAGYHLCRCYHRHCDDGDGDGDKDQVDGGMVMILVEVRQRLLRC